MADEIAQLLNTSEGDNQKLRCLLEDHLEQDDALSDKLSEGSSDGDGTEDDGDELGDVRQFNMTLTDCDSVQ
jgi:hypothetical protein